MSFDVVSIGDLLIELEERDTGHRVTFCLDRDGSDLLRGSYKENGRAGDVRKLFWTEAYLIARRAALRAGMLKLVRSDTLGPAMNEPPSATTAYRRSSPRGHHP